MRSGGSALTAMLIARYVELQITYTAASAAMRGRRVTRPS